ncbi:rhodanese-like domain-containing protein [Bacillus sp. FSL K6-3431]|uniref:rhodanese-like domain-containing protein n=1 Tax=Bacillus sp. FSL K6-3431 TaxID=2921500 RepID=UPI0030F854ED
MKQYTVDEVKVMLESKKLINILDVREAEEVAKGKIPGVIHIPLGLLEFRLQDLNKSKEYIVVCRSGGRSGSAVQLLESRGYQVVNMVGGMLEWQGEIE